LRREELANLFDVSLKTIGNWERDKVPADKEKIVRERLFAGPLRGISNQELVNELLRRLPPDWFEVLPPDDFDPRRAGGHGGHDGYHHRGADAHPRIDGVDGIAASRV
jgi:hypothetical protein